jgi:hypothetical protein
MFGSGGGGGSAGIFGRMSVRGGSACGRSTGAGLGSSTAATARGALTVATVLPVGRRDGANRANTHVKPHAELFPR